LGYGLIVDYYPDDDLLVILLGNQDNVDIATISDTLEKIALGIT
jgi:hypothetical protein